MKTNTNVGRKILAGTAATLATPFGVAATAVAGTVGILNNTLGPIIQGVFTLSPGLILMTPFSAVGTSLDTVARTTMSLAVTPISVYKAIDQEDASALYHITENLDVVSHGTFEGLAGSINH